MNTQKQSTESYKGVRDFYPEELFYRKYILDICAKTAQRFGYEEYDASILEPAELYRGKTSEEIVNEQTYTFTDRGGREVTLRPEMTPTIARMVAHKRRELGYPLRLFSNPNMFRYEKPQRGRLREFWQFNADVFGLSGVEGDAEVVALGHACITAFGAKEDQFEIQINDRRALNAIWEKHALSDDAKRSVMGLLDRKAKMPEQEFVIKMHEIVGDASTHVLKDIERIAEYPTLVQLMQYLKAQGIGNVKINPELVRGFDYYTGVIMEAFDTSPDNRRAMYGGGRYDNLLTLFGEEPVPTVGFAIGDVVLKDFLQTHGLLPVYMPATKVMICVVDAPAVQHAYVLAKNLRDAGVNVAVNSTLRKLPDQFKSAEKLSLKKVIVLGSADVDTYSLKTLGVPVEERCTFERLVALLTHTP